jgi:hypothetical protein
MMTGAVTLLAVVSLGLTGCSQGTPTDATRPASAGRGDHAQPAKGTSDTATQERPDKVCDAADTLFSRMRVTSAHWVPEQQPFDPVMAAAVRQLAQGLAVQGHEASSPAVRARIDANVKALNRLGIAMGRRTDATRVLDAVRQLRVAYAALTAACDPDSESSPEALPDTGTPSTPPASPKPRQLSPTCRKVQSVMVTVGVELAAWSPEVNPFDEATATRFRSFGDQLGTLAPQAGSTEVRNAIRENAGTFTAIADAMRSRQRSAVYDAIGNAQLTYLDLHEACSLP